jgi:hypothetical protein
MPASRFGIAGVALVCSLAPACSDQPALGPTPQWMSRSLSVTVTDAASGRPVSEAFVSLAGDPAVFGRWTDIDGRTELTVLAPPTLTLRVVHAGYYIRDQIVDYDRDRAIVVTVQPREFGPGSAQLDLTGTFSPNHESRCIWTSDPCRSYTLLPLEDGEVTIDLSAWIFSVAVYAGQPMRALVVSMPDLMGTPVRLRVDVNERRVHTLEIALAYWPDSSAFEVRLHGPPMVLLP